MAPHTTGNLEALFLVNRCGWTVNADGSLSYPTGTPRHGFDDENAAADWADSLGPEQGPEVAPETSVVCHCGRHTCPPQGCAHR